MEFLEWQSIIFLIPLIFGCLLVVGSALGVVGHGVGHDFEANIDADHDVSVGGDHDVGHDAEGDHAHAAHAFDDAHDHDADHGHGMFHRALGVLGIGRAPLSVVLMTACLLFGGTGIAANFILRPMLRIGWVYGWISVALAVVVMVVCTGAFARLVARIMPSTETYRVTSRDLLGKTGTTIYEIAAGGDGFVQVYDHEGNLHQVRVRVRGAGVPKGSGVLLEQYVRDEEMYLGRVSGSAA